MKKPDQFEVTIILSWVALILLGVIIGYTHAMVKIHNFPIQ
jgi:hypothetical protein